MRPFLLAALLAVVSASPVTEELVARDLELTDELVARQEACGSIESFRLKQVSTGLYGVFKEDFGGTIDFTGTTPDSASAFSLNSKRVLYLSGQPDLFAAIPKPGSFSGEVKPIDFPNVPPVTPPKYYRPLTCSIGTQAGGTCSLQCSVTTQVNRKTGKVPFDTLYIQTCCNDLWLGESYNPYPRSWKKAGKILVEPA